jgi:hypothetical protein
VEARQPEGRDLLHHSDRGCQYTSDAYQQTLRVLGIQCSMSRTGCCYDISEAGEEMRHVLSKHKTPGQAREREQDKHSHCSREFVADDKREHKKMTHLNQYYDEVIAGLGSADAIHVVGPGEAKGEFVKRLEAKKLKGRLAHVGTVDRMTDRQVAAHVRELIRLGS